MTTPVVTTPIVTTPTTITTMAIIPIIIFLCILLILSMFSLISSNLKSSSNDTNNYINYKTYFSEGILEPGTSVSFDYTKLNTKSLETCFKECENNIDCQGANFTPFSCNIKNNTDGTCHLLDSYLSIKPPINNNIDSSTEFCPPLYFKK